MILIGQRRGQAGDVVIVHKADELQAAVHTPILAAKAIFEGETNLEQIHSIQGGINALVTLIVGGAVQHPIADDVAVVAVDHLAGEEKVGAFRGAKRAELSHKPAIEHIGYVQTQAVDAEIVHPLPHPLQ